MEKSMARVSICIIQEILMMVIGMRIKCKERGYSNIKMVMCMMGRDFKDNGMDQGLIIFLKEEDIQDNGRTI